jgi:hypothetical protein
VPEQQPTGVVAERAGPPECSTRDEPEQLTGASLVSQLDRLGALPS